MENKIDKKDVYSKDLIEKKLFEIANDNNYELAYRNDELGPNHIFLIFQNKKNLKFISAFANEKGFSDEEYDHID